jgi:hypothetical protein
VIKGGEVHEMDVPPCNPLLDLWFVAMVLSKTLNGSSEFIKDLRGRLFFAGLFYFFRGNKNYFTFIRVCNMKSLGLDGG